MEVVKFTRNLALDVIKSSLDFCWGSVSAVFALVLLVEYRIDLRTMSVTKWFILFIFRSIISFKIENCEAVRPAFRRFFIGSKTALSPRKCFALRCFDTPNRVLLALLLAMVFCANTLATEPIVRHPASLVRGDVFVKRTGLTMRLTCFAEDLEMLQGVEALETGFYDSDEIKDATQDHAEYLAERVTIRDVDGNLLKPKISEVVDAEIPEGGIPAGKLMEYQLQFVLEYKYDKAPEFITIQQNMVAEGALLPSEFHVLLKQAGSGQPFAKTLKPEAPETFRFDWDNPVLSEDDSKEDWEKWFDVQREKTLGISSYGSVYSFIYITDHEVRHEVLIPLATLTSVMEIQRKDKSFLEVDEQVAATEQVKAFFGAGNPVTIDGIEVKPVFDRVDFYGLNLSDFAVRPEKRKVSMASGRVGVIMSYSAKSRPTEVTVEWNLMSSAIREVDSVVIAYSEVLKTKFSKFLSDNVYRWKAPDRPPLPPITGLSGSYDMEKYAPTLTVSWATIGLWGLAAAMLMFGLFVASSVWPYLLVALAGLVGSYFVSDYAVATYDHPWQQSEQFELSEEEAADIFGRLHANMFRAFDYVDESDVYQALAKSVDGDLLRDLYLQINQSLRVQEQGGAVAVIEKVQLVDGNPLPVPEEFAHESPVRFGYRANWTLDGTIEHWGHIHQRTNRYQARFVVEFLEGDDDQAGWKITGIQDQEFEPGVVKRRLRKF